MIGYGSLVGAALLLLGCRANVEVLTASSGAPPRAGSCGLAAPAFCDTFAAPHPGGRAGALDESVWSVARYTSHNNPPQGMVAFWTPSDALICGQRGQAILPDDDFRICDGRLEETIDDASAALVVHSMRARQAFDFGGAGATITFDVDAKVDEALVWIEVWIIDQPVPGIFTRTLPRNGVGLKFGTLKCPDKSARVRASLDNISLVRDYQFVGQSAVNEPVCFATADGVLNHFEIRVASSHLELWGTDRDDRGTFRRLGWKDVAIPFTVGYVSFAHVQYQTGKFLPQSAETYRWKNLGFDGPFHPRPRAADVADALVPKDNGVNLGYWLGPPRTDPQRFTLAGLRTAQAESARLAFNIDAFRPTTALRWRLNGGVWHDHPYVNVDAAVQTRAETAVVSVSELREGANTLDFSAVNVPVGGLVLTNIDVTVEIQP